MDELEPWRETPGYTDAPKATPPDPEVGSEIALELLHHVIEKGGELARRASQGQTVNAVDIEPLRHALRSALSSLPGEHHKPPHVYRSRIFQHLVDRKFVEQVQDSERQHSEAIEEKAIAIARAQAKAAAYEQSIGVAKSRRPPVGGPATGVRCSSCSSAPQLSRRKPASRPGSAHEASAATAAPLDDWEDTLVAPDPLSIQARSSLEQFKAELDDDLDDGGGASGSALQGGARWRAGNCGVRCTERRTIVGLGEQAWRAGDKVEPSRRRPSSAQHRSGGAGGGCAGGGDGGQRRHGTGSNGGAAVGSLRQRRVEDVMSQQDRVAAALKAGPPKGVPLDMNPLEKTLSKLGTMTRRVEREERERVWAESRTWPQADVEPAVGGMPWRFGRMLKESDSYVGKCVASAPSPPPRSASALFCALCVRTPHCPRVRRLLTAAHRGDAAATPHPLSPRSSLHPDPMPNSPLAPHAGRASRTRVSSSATPTAAEAAAADGSSTKHRRRPSLAGE